MSEPTQPPLNQENQAPSKQEIHDLANDTTLQAKEKNQHITAMYHRLSKVIQTRLDRTSDLDWCGFAKWSSKTVGRDLDPDMTGVRIENLVDQLPPLPPSLEFLKATITDILRSLRDQPIVIDALRTGNDVIFDEMGTVYVSMIERLQGTPQPVEDDEPFAREVVDEVRNLKPATRGGRITTEHLAERNQDTVEKLVKGIQLYLRAAREPDHASELMLAGSMLFSTYEQTRAQRLITIGVCGPARAAARNLFPLAFPGDERDLVLAARPHPRLILRELDDVLAPFLTEHALAVVIGERRVPLGRPEPALPVASVTPTLTETKDVLDRLEPLPQDDGTRDWTDLNYRLRVIRRYFAALQRDAPDAQKDPLLA